MPREILFRLPYKNRCPSVNFWSAVAPTTSDNRTVVIDGKRYIETNTHRIQYRFSETAGINHRERISALVDRGANGGLAGGDVRVLEHTLRQADISGIDNHTTVGLPIVTAAGVVNTHVGPVCVILHQYALLGKGKSIHSSVQMECHDIVLDERSRRLQPGGQQCLTTLEGYEIPLSICRGLPYMDMHPPSDHKLDTLPQVVLTSDANWDPTMADNEIEPDNVWYNTLDTGASPGTRAYGDTKFDHMGITNRTSSLFGTLLSSPKTHLTMYWSMLQQWNPSQRGCLPV